MMPPTIETDRLILRDWKPSDLAPFAQMNADPKVMEFFPSPLSRDESDLLAKNIQKELSSKPYGLFAVQVKEGPDFIGFIGLHDQDFEAPFTPCTEIGWRLASPSWGKGYATEGALAVLEYGLNTLKLKEIVSFTSKKNKPSIKVMEKIGLKRNPKDDFNHSKLPKEHPLSPHVLYRT